MSTDYPFGGTVALRAIAVPAGACEVAVRVPSWASAASATLNDKPVANGPGADGYCRFRREWSAGDELVIEFPMRPRVVRGSDDIDAIRGCVAFERGPLVYCLEGHDVDKSRRSSGCVGGRRQCTDRRSRAGYRRSEHGRR